jgi:hypothetical protein
MQLDRTSIYCSKFAYVSVCCTETVFREKQVDDVRGPHAGVDYNLTLRRLQHMLHGHPMPEST